MIFVGLPGREPSILTIVSCTMFSGCGDNGGELGSGLVVSTVCVEPTGGTDTTTCNDATASSVSWAITLSVCSITWVSNSCKSCKTLGGSVDDSFSRLDGNITYLVRLISDQLIVLLPKSFRVHLVLHRLDLFFQMHFGLSFPFQLSSELGDLAIVRHGMSIGGHGYYRQGVGRHATQSFVAALANVYW